jgi:hypothetical protein
MWHELRPWVDRPEKDYYDWAKGIRSADELHKIAHDSFDSLFHLGLSEIADRQVKVAAEVRDKLCRIFNQNPRNKIKPEQVVLGASISELSNLMVYAIKSEYRVSENQRYEYEQFYNVTHLSPAEAKKAATKQVFGVNSDYDFYEFEINERATRVTLHLCELLGRGEWNFLGIRTPFPGIEVESSFEYCVAQDTGISDALRWLKHSKEDFILIDGAHVSKFSNIPLRTMDVFFGSFGKYLAGEPLAFAIVNERMVELIRKHKDRVGKISGQFAYVHSLGVRCDETADWISLPELEAANLALANYLTIQDPPSCYSFCLAINDHSEPLKIYKTLETFEKEKGMRVGAVFLFREEQPIQAFRISFSQYQHVEHAIAWKLLQEVRDFHHASLGYKP